MSKYLAAILLLGLCCRSAAAQTLAFISDLNGRYGSTEYHQRVSAAVAALVELRPSLVVIGGDMIAGQATPLLDAATVEAMWQGFDKSVYQPLTAAGIRVAATPGNHDASAYPLFSGERLAYQRYWSTRPAADAYSDGSNYPWFFGIDLDGLSLAFLDVTTTAELDTGQRAFLSLRRAQAKAREARLIVITHLPLYPVAQGRESEVFTLPGSSLAGETWVSGHHHAYYPGTSGSGALHLALPALGGNARNWIGSTEHSPFGYVTLGAQGSIELRAWPGFGPAGPATWPAAIGGLRAVTALPPPG